MISFCLNNCQGKLQIHEDSSIDEAFASLIRAFKDIGGTRIYKTHTPKAPDQIRFASVTLDTLLKRLSKADKNLGRLGYKMFSTSYPLPIRDDIEIKDDELGSYILFGENAEELWWAHKSGFWIMSVPLCDECKVDQLVIERENDGLKLAIHNWHGHNTTYLKRIEAEAKKEEERLLDNISYLKEGKNVILSHEFIDKFKKADSNIQNLIYSRFKDALTASLLFPCKGDDNIVKKVEYKNHSCYELRQKGLGIRIYFDGDHDNLYVADLNFKSNYKQEVKRSKLQSEDILRASKIVKRMKCK